MPVFRFITFWSGLLVLCLLVTIIVDSRYRYTSVTGNLTPTATTYLVLRDGYLDFWLEPSLHSHRSGPLHFDRQARPPDAGRDTRPNSTFRYYSAERFGIEARLMSLVYLHLLIWLPLLYFIRRRKQPVPDDGSPPENQPKAPIPWHESDTFRTGLFILPLLMWTWVDSLGHHSTLGCGLRSSPGFDYYNVEISSRDSQITARFMLLSPGTTSADYPFSLYHERRAAETFSRGLGFTLPAWSDEFIPSQPYEDGGDPSRPGVSPSAHVFRLSLPYWLLITGHILLFTAILRYRFTRQRRRQRLLPSTQPQAHPTFEN